MINAEKERPPNLRYAAETITLMDQTADTFYDTWLELSIERALEEGRIRVVVEDAVSTLEGALNRLLEERHDEATTSKSSP